MDLEQEESIHYSIQDEASTVDAEVKHNSEDKDSKVDKTFAASKAANEDPVANDDKDEVVEITPVAVVNATL